MDFLDSQSVPSPSRVARDTRRTALSAGSRPRAVWATARSISGVYELDHVKINDELNPMNN